MRASIPAHGRGSEPPPTEGGLWRTPGPRTEETLNMNLSSAMRPIWVLATITLLVGGCQSTKGETLGEKIDDASITTAVKAKLAEDRPATLTQVGVETILRTVHLTGAVKDEFLRQRAAELAKGVKGLREVMNDTTAQANP